MKSVYKFIKYKLKIKIKQHNGFLSSKSAYVTLDHKTIHKGQFF